jgi:hypothetical protein
VQPVSDVVIGYEILDSGNGFTSLGRKQTIKSRDEWRVFAIHCGVLPRQTLQIPAGNGAPSPLPQLVTGRGAAQARR